MRALVSNRREYISEIVKSALHEKTLSESAFSYGFETGRAGTPDALKVDLEISQLSDLLKDKTKTLKDPSSPTGIRTITIPGSATFSPGSKEARNVERKIKMLKASKGRVNLPRRAGAIARQAYEGGLGMAKSAIAGTVSRGVELALGKGTKSVGLEGLGIASPVDAPDLSRINR